jgi:2Fe-2S ferredoxin
MVKIVFKSKEREQLIEASVGDTILEAAQKNGIRLFAGCRGAGVCGTCHVNLDRDTDASSEERDLLEVVSSGQNSRLACQVIISKEFDGMVVTIP